jgi:UDP-N-acetyl-D-mannosaminuronate dehydrogenase
VTTTFVRVPDPSFAEHLRDRVDAFVPVDGARVLCLGAADAAGVNDTRDSHALAVMELLHQAGAWVDFADPIVDVANVDHESWDAVDLATVDLRTYDLIVVLVANTAWPRDELLAAGVPVFDAVNAFDGTHGTGYETL